MRKLQLEHKLAPGDVLVMSALVRDLALTYQDKLQTTVNTSCGELWRHNPHTKWSDDVSADTEHIKLQYGETLKHVATSNKHFLLGFYEDFERQTGIHVPLLYPRPDYHLSEEEKQSPLVSGRYWVIVSGGKTDFTTKHWSYKRYQQVVNVLKSGGINCVQVGAIGYAGPTLHYHPRLENTLCLAGLTTLRDIGRLIYHAEGVICSVTMAMHLAAALQKPCVVIAGGREEWWWEAYVNKLGNFGTELREEVQVPHRFLHTIGQLPCCEHKGCWCSTIEPGKNSCTYPLLVSGQTLPACMDSISVNHVIEAVMSYYADGTLPPIGHPKTIVVVDGRLKVLAPSELIPEQPKSALVEALNLPEPRLLTPTEGIHVIQGSN